MTKDGRLKRNTALLATFLAGALLVVACHSSEVVAPEGATISLSANPAQVIVQGGQQLAPIAIIATVRDAIGVPLPGQDVRFTTTNGVLTPQASTPVTTDKLGNAMAQLNGVQQAPQVTATSGKATANLSLTIGTAAICLIDVSPSGDQSLNACSDTIDFTVTVFDCSNKPVANTLMKFELVSGGNTNAVAGNFNPNSIQTDANGQATSTLTFDPSSCSSNCVGLDNNNSPKQCDAQVSIHDASGLFTHTPIKIIDNIN
jgi:hypothetical protein